VTDAVVLNWDVSSGGPAGFRIYASIDGPEFAPSSANLVGSTSSATFAFATSNYTTWHFVVTTIDKFGIESLPSRTSGKPISPFDS
jgi:hypothetical protein